MFVWVWPVLVNVPTPGLMSGVFVALLNEARETVLWRDTDNTSMSALIKERHSCGSVVAFARRKSFFC